MIDDKVRARSGLMTALLVASVWFIGLAFLAWLPPWEGFDETAHWSYIQQLADTGAAPRYGLDRLSADVDAYPGPMKYGEAPPFEATGRETYRSYRTHGSSVSLGGPTHYAPGRTLNWQAQHPALYYALMAPIYRATSGLGWVNHFLALRLASFSLAFAGYVLGVGASVRWAQRATSPAIHWAGPVIAAWPFLFPQFFPEFARLGNDSLCLLIVGAAWSVLLRILQPGSSRVWAAALGVLLGAGLLTKAFFVPLGAGVGLLLLVRWFCERRAAQLSDLLVTCGMAAAIGGWWYLQKYLQTGSWTGSDEFIRLNQAGGLASAAAHFSVAELGRGLAAIPATFVWAGTWSLARLPELLLIAPIGLLGVTLFEYGRSLLAQNLDPDPGLEARLVLWAPLALAGPMAAGLVYHIAAWMAGTAAVTPGWYFHILAAPLGLAVAMGWRRPLLLSTLTGATIVYTIAAWAFQLSMFSGCAAKLGQDKHYSLRGAGCFLDAHALSAITHPAMGAACFAVGVGLGLVAAAFGVQQLRGGAPHDQPGLTPF